MVLADNADGPHRGRPFPLADPWGGPESQVHKVVHPQGSIHMATARGGHSGGNRGDQLSTRLPL